MKEKLSIFLLVLVFVSNGIAQKEANVWYFGEYAGLDFNGGEPNTLLGMFHDLRGCASISDSSGIFLFTTDGGTIWNREKEIMQNGEDLKGRKSHNGVLILQKPGSNHFYYVFTATSFNEPPGGMYYSIVDMTLDNGLGAVTETKNIPLNVAWDAVEKLTAIKHANNKDIWIIARKQKENSFASFLLTSTGIDDEAVLSFAPYKVAGLLTGGMKVTYNKKFFISADEGFGLPGHEPYNRFEIHRFNSCTGQLDYMYPIWLEDDQGNSQNPNSVEFSPDSKLAYLCTWSISHDVEDGTEHRVYQYDMSLIEDSAQFVESALLISHNGGSGLQLATDGKIYCGINDIGLDTESPVHIIHKPWKRGSACDFEENAIEFQEGYGAIETFPNILLDFLYRFEWEGHCSADPFYFQSNFQPDPSFIEWNFSDPLSGNNISHDINPVHTFTYGGEIEVFVYVEYPNGRIEETSRVVSVTKTPKPNLGPDILKCEDEQLTLNAGNETGFYSWSTGAFGQGANEILVSDTGTYWVRVENDDCVGYDTIYVGLFPKPGIIEDNLELIPTACGGSVGKILGLEIYGTEPLSFSWYDGNGNLIANTIDIENLGVGNYYLHILDGNGCTTISNAYTIDDAGDISISDVEKEDTHCGQDMGSIVVTAASGSSGDLLFSIDNGNSWQTADNSFDNLPAANYFVRVKDQNDCEVVYENNPVVVVSIGGPQVVSTTSLPEVDYLSNGEINLSAVVSSGGVFYSIDNGSSFQTNNGLFTNLPSGYYYCMVKDNFGCDTTFVVEVELIISQLIDAIAGDGYTCIGNAAVVPLKLDNFTDVFKFNVKLTYDTTVLNCDGFISIHPLLDSNIMVSIVPGTNYVVVSWQGEAPTTLEENATMLELVFGAKDEGFSNIDWVASTGESAFYNEQLDEISTHYYMGSLRIYTRPEIMMFDKQEKCIGDEFTSFPFVEGGTGALSYEWTGPDSFYSTNDLINIQNMGHQNAGVYNLKVTDTINCVESAQVNVIVYDNPVITFPVEDTIVEQSGFILDAGSGYKYYLWNTGETTPAIEIQQEGLYSVYVTTQQDCKSTDSVTVLWSQAAFYLPNAFTPNGDGLNDEFKPVQKYDFVNIYHLSIFSRWGEMIFESSDINQGWDGSYKGNPSQQGSYIYKIVYTAWPNKEEKQVLTGSVTLVR